MAKRKTKPRPISEQLRRLIDASGLSRYRIAKETGVDQAQLSKFMSGERGLSLAAIDTICKLLDLELTQRQDS